MGEIEALMEQQGWTDRTLGYLALGFVTADSALKDRFVSHLRSVAADENEDYEDD